MIHHAIDPAASAPVSASVTPPSTIGASLDRVISEYLAAWNSVDDRHRLRHLDATWSDSSIFEDPLVRIEGRGAMNAHIAACRAAQPDIQWSVTSDIAHQRGRILFAWKARDGHGREILAGHSYGELDAQGRIRRIVGFISSPRSCSGAGSK